MSQYDINNVLKRAQTLDISTTFQPYSGVEIVVDDETTYTAGNANGRVLTIENPWGTQTQADNILEQIKGFAYQPYEASGALIEPIAELGDGVSVNGVYSGVYKLSRNFSSLMSADVSAPQSEEIDHEYPYESKQTRSITRRFSAIDSELSIQSNKISAKVSTTLNPETYSSSSTYEVGDYCKRTVSGTTYMYKCTTAIETPEAWNSAHWSAAQSLFGWTLEDNQWSVFNQNGTLFKVTSSGAEVTGTITATSGQIGGFTIGSSAIYKDTTSLTSSTKGIYLGTNGIRINGSDNAYFLANKNGTIEANKLKLTGTLTIGSSTIDANSLRTGAISGGKYGTATGSASPSSYPTYFTVTYLFAKAGITAEGTTTIKGSLYVQGGAGGQYLCKWKTIIVNGVSYVALCQAP